MRTRILLFTLTFLSTIAAIAQHLNPELPDSLQPNMYIVRSTMYGVGSINMLDTYLSPVEYTGIQLHLLRESARMTKMMDGNVSRQTIFQGYIANAENRADTGNELAGMVNWNYALHYNFSLMGGKLKLLVGPMWQINGGFIYNTRNSNNPAQAKLYTNLATSGMAAYHFKWENSPVMLRYQLDVPITGVMFSPKYQQSYYEIFSQDDRSGTVVFTSLHNQPSLRHWFTADISRRTFTLRLGYMGDMHQSKVNHIKCHTYTHSFMIGLVKHLYRIKP